MRNLLYNITPIGCWRWNVKQLRRYIDRFDGVRIASIAVCPQWSAEVEEVKAEIKDMFDIVMLQPNDPQLRDAATQPGLFKSLFRCCREGLTFYAHTKGVSYESRPAVTLWTQLCYAKNLGDIALVAETLRKFPVCGCFKRYGHIPPLPPQSLWHYSGSFFWFDTKALFARSWRRGFLKHRWSAESYPSLIFRAEEAACLYGEHACNLYDYREVKRLIRRHGENVADYITGEALP